MILIGSQHVDAGPAYCNYINKQMQPMVSVAEGKQQQSLKSAKFDSFDSLI